MRALGFWVLLLVAGAALGFVAPGSSRDGDPDSAFIDRGDVTSSGYEDDTVVIINRELKERSYDIHTTSAKRDLGGINMEDYPRFDPAPNSKAAIKSGPIEHGTPLMPYVPQPTPPNHPKHGSP